MKSLFLLTVLIFSVLTGFISSSFCLSDNTVSIYSATLIFHVTTDSVVLILNDNVIAFLNASLSVSEGESKITHLSYNDQNVRLKRSLPEHESDEVVFTMVVASLVGIDLVDYMYVTLYKGSVGYAEVKIFNSNDDPPIEVATLSCSGDNVFRKNFSIETSELTNRGPTNVMSKGLRGKVSPKVLAFHYPWYGNTSVSGEWVHWYSGSQLATTDNPLWGLYDSKDIGLIDMQIQKAKESDIDGFIVSWWGIDTFEDEAFNLVLDRAAVQDFRATIYYEPVRDGPSLTAEQAIEELGYVLEKYSTSPGFLTFNGRPVIFIFWVSAYPLEFWSQVFDSIEERGYLALWIGDNLDLRYNLVFDGLHTYGQQLYLATDSLNDEGTYNSFSRIRDMSDVMGKLWFAPTMPGFSLWDTFGGSGRDSRLSGGFLGEAGAPYLSRYDGWTYKNLWSAGLNSDPDGVTITSWNEWHEGSEIEPSVEYSDLYLNLTRRFAREFKYEVLSEVSTKFLLAPENNVSFIYADPYRMNSPDSPWTSGFAAYDATAAGILYGLCKNRQRVIFDYDDDVVVAKDPELGPSNYGEVLLSGERIVVMGGPIPNWVVDYYERTGQTPLRYNHDPVNPGFAARNGSTVAAVPSTIDFTHNDLFVVMMFQDSRENSVLIIYGLQWKGTFAGGLYFKEVIKPNMENHINSAYVFRWTDAGDMDGVPQIEEIEQQYSICE